MSVIKNRRGLSELQVYKTARTMRKDITFLTLRDFGIHSRGKKFKEETGSQQPEGFYDELIAEYSKNIRLILRNMMLNITAANTIYPINFDEVTLRRRYQTGAIINCEQLIQELQYCKDIMPVKASMFVPYEDIIDKEIELLKGWRKSNNKFYKIIEEKQRKKEEQNNN